MLADAFLGSGVRPFEGFRPPDDMRAHYWYGSVFSMSHYDLAEILLTTVQDAWHDDAWVLEAGSFIGNSAVTWASTMRALQMRSVVVCIDTWLGDIIMWEKRGKMLGKPGADGQPRLFEQFMLNVAGKNMTEYVLPLRMPASIGLLYVRRHVEQQGLPPPAIIYVDTAHTVSPHASSAHVLCDVIPLTLHPLRAHCVSTPRRSSSLRRRGRCCVPAAS